MRDSSESDKRGKYMYKLRMGKWRIRKEASSEVFSQSIDFDTLYNNTQRKNPSGIAGALRSTDCPEDEVNSPQPPCVKRRNKMKGGSGDEFKF
jgi:hypothetical protein